MAGNTIGRCAECKGTYGDDECEVCTICGAGPLEVCTHCPPSPTMGG